MRKASETAEQQKSSVADDSDKTKRKNRRSNRRLSKTNLNNTSSPSCGSTSEAQREASEFWANGRRSIDLDGSGTHCLNEHNNKGLNVAFRSMPSMHVPELMDSAEGLNAQNQTYFTDGRGGTSVSTPCPEPVGCGRPVESDSYFQRKCFAPHWSLEAVNDELEKVDVFRALFRVNAHNRVEAYCKIDGVPVDILVNGFAPQNRAVEGDIVAIKIDPVTLWSKMKGSVGSANTSSTSDDCKLYTELNGTSGGSAKGKTKIDADHDLRENNCSPISENGCSKGCPSNSEIGSVTPSRGVNEVGNAVERMCALVNKFPSKRPTGKVIAILEKSPRRDSVVGFLNVKQWLSNRDPQRNDSKKNKNCKPISDYEYIQLTPNDPRFPKMILPINSSPECIRGRLEDGDVTVESELLAVRLDCWEDECPIPQASVLHIFGRGDEIEPQLEAILFEHAICTSEFSPESISCIPSVSWEVPHEEYERRRDIRNICILTIDPSTATDLDDALSVERLSDCVFRVGVHIADVSYFVLPDTALDIEARIRSTSVYMLQRKLPMLPSKLSDEMVSLNPGVDRLAFSIFWDINSAGDIIDRWIGRTVIKSCCKLSYDYAQDIIDGTIDLEFSDCLEKSKPQLHGCFKWHDVVESVKSLYEISRILKEKRFSDGALQLDNSKIVFLFDECGNPYDSVLSGSKDSNFLVEEFMLLANRTAAEIISRAYPDGALLRRHPEPIIRKLREFESFCCKHGLLLDTSSSGQFRQSLEQIREKLKGDTVLVDILNNYAARPMQLASYFCSGESKLNENDWAHYALAVPLYTHFTSPLRRYADIIVHRTLAATLEAEELYQKQHQKTLQRVKKIESSVRCFTGIYFDRDAAESVEGKESLSATALKHRVPCTENLADIAAYCNQRKLASRYVKDACDKLYMWALLKRREVMLSEARVLGLGPKFMSIYICKLAVERRIYYDEVEGLKVEWLESTCALVLSFSKNKHLNRRGNPSRCRALEDFAWIVSPQDLVVDPKYHLGHFDIDESALESDFIPEHVSSKINIDPAMFPLTVRLLSTIPVALHAVGGDDGPLDIGVRLYMCSYIR